MTRIADILVLPPEVTSFEQRYVSRINRIALFFLLAHVPVLGAVAALNGGVVGTTLVLASLNWLGPWVASRWLPDVRKQSVVMGVAAMMMGALLVWVGQGPMQVEMHFYFFVLLALETVFANPIVIVVSAASIVLHHVVLFAVLPGAAFNYEATLGTIAIHGIFVALEVVATVFVARQFFDNVIGLERIVAAHTTELGRRADAMRLVLDHVTDGLATIDGRGLLSGERSRRFDEWFGPIGPGDTVFDALGRADPEFGRASRLAWSEVSAAVMPLALTMDQMPRRFALGDRTLRVSYLPVSEAEPPERTLLVIRDVTDEHARDEANQHVAEAVEVLDRAQSDPTGFGGLVASGEEVLGALESAQDVETTLLLRLVHTLKGNTAMYGLQSVAAACHAIEDQVTATGDRPAAQLVERLRARWRSAIRLAAVVGRKRGVVELDQRTFEAVDRALASDPRGADALARLRAASTVPVRPRLEQFARQAERIAERLGKQVTVEISDGGVRLDPDRWRELWLALVHAVRNAVDHGIELPEERRARGKDPVGRLRLSAFIEGPQLVVEIADDGAGIDFESLRDRAATRGIVGVPDEALVWAGVSTAAAVTSISGRGVGMRSVLEAVRAAGGSVHVETAPAAGSVLRVRLPVDAAVRTPGSQERAISAA